MSGFSSAGLERLSDALKGYVDRGEIPGLVALVARGDDGHVNAFVGLTTVLLTQRMMAGPNDVAINTEFRTLARQACKD